MQGDLYRRAIANREIVFAEERLSDEKGQAVNAHKQFSSDSPFNRFERLDGGAALAH
jgi:hypothetical protein